MAEIYQSIHTGAFIDQQITEVSNKLSKTDTAEAAKKLATARTISLTGDVTGSGSFDGSNNLSIATTSNVRADLEATGFIQNTGLPTQNADGWASMLQKNRITMFTNWWDHDSVYTPYIYGSGLMIPHLDHKYRSFLYFNCNQQNAYIGYLNYTDSGSTVTTPTWKKIWVQGDSVTGAVWNDYAECRESDCDEPGYVLSENGDDTLSKSAERLAPFAGVSSDTWGFSQGETARARTPIAVAGRVLVYPYQDRNNYKPGDCVCAAPGGTVDIMTREEVREWPDRIVGTVSCVPDYEEWGGGEGADRDPVKVNGRIWIKVK